MHPRYSTANALAKAKRIEVSAESQKVSSSRLYCLRKCCGTGNRISAAGEGVESVSSELDSRSSDVESESEARCPARAPTKPNQASRSPAPLSFLSSRGSA